MDNWAQLLYLFLIGFLSTGLGRISGAGGAVVIKPVLDATLPLSVSAISFLSGATVWVMTLVTLILQRRNPVKIDWSRTTYLAGGAALGGVVGKTLFNTAKSLLGQDQLVGAIQSALLFILIGAVYVLVKNRDRLPSKDYRHPLICVGLGLVLSFLAAFLGIGGGPLNVAVLMFFLGMGVKESALNSLFIIFCSQSLSIGTALITRTLPVFPLPYLIVMAISGVLGGLIGSLLSKRLSVAHVNQLFVLILFVVALTSAYNFIRFAF